MNIQSMLLCADCGPYLKLHLFLSSFDYSLAFNLVLDHCATTMADCSKKSLEIFILSGQSNMSGRGGIRTTTAGDGSTIREWDGILPAECATESGAILRLNKNLDWEEAHEPLHADIDVGMKVHHPDTWPHFFLCANGSVQCGIFTGRLVITTLLCNTGMLWLFFLAIRILHKVL